MAYKKNLEGEKAINFCLNNKYGKKYCLNETKSKWVILFFFDKTSFTSEKSEILFYSKVQEQFKALQAEILGVGPVSEEEIRKFCRESGCDIILLSDLDYKVSEEYGVVNFSPEKIKKILPMTFLIDKNKYICKYWNRERMYYRYSEYGGDAINLWEQSRMWAHIEKVLDTIESLDKNTKFRWLGKSY